MSLLDIIAGLITLLGVQFCFRRFPIDGFSGRNK